MIFVLLTRPHAYTVQHYLETWGRDARGMVTTLFYEDLAFGGLLIGIILLVFSFLLAAVSTIFVLRNSKKEWDAKNLK